MTSQQQEETLASLAATLDEYLRAIPRQNEVDGPDLMAIFARLDDFERRLDSTYDPQLRHYLHQKSYRKAHLYLQGRNAENIQGNCGRK